ncbi:CPBP family glutamic-type intramembrane protease [Anaerosacchariphilus polymeriproducens]|uniref:CPBP family intramembrane metalloprotease n=1 Tax=Anaerosacchariphilus polymeriproducens TaxID=1812858 RepID=A0A371AXM2_9FIRM|nr:CPBP family glutamic-type intramembrane protease [Anaerosacchariphilus polymeriproducens]RDU24335.1 CPBP family intramembrane metalloprotease [Anaerosacchariphilus polymeriproducens]
MFKRVREISDVKFILLSVLICFIFNYLFIYIAGLFGINITDEIYIKDYNSFSIFMFILITFIGPGIETILLVYLVKIAKIIIKRNYIVAVLISIIFGALHYHSISYMLIASGIGYIYIFSYMFYPNKRFTSYKILFLIHSIYNCISYITNIFK